MKGYQYLENDFFGDCRKANIRSIPLLLLIYLRGNAFYCQDAIFYCKDKDIIADLGIEHRTLSRAREILKERQAIDYESYKGRKGFTWYALWEKKLADIKKRDKSLPLRKCPTKSGKNPTFNNKSYLRVINREEVFKGISKDERTELTAKGLL